MLHVTNLTNRKHPNRTVTLVVIRDTYNLSTAHRWVTVAKSSLLSLRVLQIYLCVAKHS